MFRSLNTVAFCRLVISLRRGCLQLPGLSTTWADFFNGVEKVGDLLVDLVAIAVDDMVGSLRDGLMIPNSVLCCLKPASYAPAKVGRTESCPGCETARRLLQSAQ